MTKRKPLNLTELTEITVLRAEEVFHKSINDWSPTDWGCALAGEVGELCNFLKKRLRGNKIKDKDIANELGDVQSYLVLTAARLGIDLEKATRDKFNEVSHKKKSKYFL